LEKCHLDIKTPQCLVLGGRRSRKNINRDLVHGSQRRHDDDRVGRLGRHGGQLDTFIRVATVCRRWWRRHRMNHRWRRRNGTITSVDVSRRNVRLRRNRSRTVVDNSSSVGTTTTSAAGTKAAAGANKDKEENESHDIENNAADDGDDMVDLLLNFTVNWGIRSLGSKNRTILASVALVANANIKNTRRHTMSTTDFDRSAASCKRSILANASIQINNNTSVL